MIGCHGSYGNEITIAEAKERFEKHVNGKESLTSDLKAAVFTIAMANGDESTFNQLLAVSEGGCVCVCVCVHVCVHVQVSKGKRKCVYMYV